MNNSNLKRKTFKIAFLPVIILIWMVGWILVSFGSPETNPKTANKRSLTHYGIAEEEEQEESPPTILA